jgi:diadenosine tetraphosphate (Ap4A) HIT family hydrolase
MYALKYFKIQTDSVQISIQDGDDAGMTIEHCHIHIIPMTKKIVFDEIDSKGK